MNRMVQIENVQADHCGDEILSIVLQAKAESEPSKIQIEDAQGPYTSDAAC